MADKAWASLPAATPDNTTEVATATHGGVWKKFNLWTWLSGLLKSSATMSGAAITKALPANSWAHTIAVTNATGSTQTFHAGLSLGTNELVDTGEVPAGTTVTFPIHVFANVTKTLHLTPVSGGALNFNFLII